MAVETPRSVLKNVAGWKLGPTLGKGGFGHVRLASHPTGRECAVKILPALDFSVPIRKDDLLDAQEAQKEVVMLKVFGGLGMRGMVSLDLVKEEAGWKYLFLPLVPKVASTLKAPIPYHILVTTTRALLCNLHCLHAIGIIHEDLKPANILMTEHGYPILADFGFATFTPNGRRMTGGGGTLDFLSPEKVEGHPYHGAPADVWACGILLYKWLTGGHPYIRDRGNDTDEVIEARIVDEEPDFSAMDKIPPMAADLLRGMLIKHPKQRWTIPQILAHPFLNPMPVAHHRPIFVEMPLLPTLSDEPVPKPDEDILLEVVFLSYTAGEWHPGMSDSKIRERLARSTKYGNWEKRMYNALAAWKSKEPQEVGMTDEEVKSARASARAGNKPLMKQLIRVMSETTIGGSPPKQSAERNPNRLSAAFPEIKREKEPSPVLVEATAKINVPKPVEVVEEETVKKPAKKQPAAAAKKAKATAVAPPKKKQATKAKAKQVEPELSETDKDEDDGEEFLPAPLPPKKVPVLRRSPRLAGMAPEMAGLGLQAPVMTRRTKPGQ